MMTISWQRLIYYLGLGLVEATPPALLLTLAGGDAWGALILTVLAGALADWVILRRVSPVRQGPALALAGLLCALYVAKGQVAPGMGALGGWGAVFGALFSLGDGRSGTAYLGLVAALYCFWRGTRMTLHDTVSLHRLFRNVTIGLLLIVGLTLYSIQSETVALLASRELLIFFVVGLVTIALASATEDRDVGLHRLGWRGMLTLLGSIALVLVLGLAVGSLFGREAGLILRFLWQGVVLIVALILAPIFYLLGLLFERFFNMISLSEVLEDMARRQQLQTAPPPVVTELLGIFPPWVRAILNALCALIPILLVITLLLLARRRLRRNSAADEERESLWSWKGLAADLRGLLRRDTPKRAKGLRDVLGRLRGGDPVSRIRRSYIRLLLVGEGRGHSRAAPQTPHEYAPNAGAMLPAAGQPIVALTDAYERARYHPAAVTPADADAAERAWDAIDEADRRLRRNS
jgi:hypothetical protein